VGHTGARGWGAAVHKGRVFRGERPAAPRLAAVLQRLLIHRQTRISPLPMPRDRRALGAQSPWGGGVCAGWSNCSVGRESSPLCVPPRMIAWHVCWVMMPGCCVSWLGCTSDCGAWARRGPEAEAENAEENDAPDKRHWRRRAEPDAQPQGRTAKAQREALRKACGLPYDHGDYSASFRGTYERRTTCGRRWLAALGQQRSQRWPSLP